MDSKIFWINSQVLGTERLGIMPRPSGGAQLNQEICNFKKNGINTIVCLLENKEIDKLGLPLEKSICLENEIDFIHFPIPDFSTPQSEDDYINLVNRIIHKLNLDEKVIIHCHGGIGRSSMIASGVMIKRGIEKHAVFDEISGYREHPVPDMKFQKEWVLNISKKLLY